MSGAWLENIKEKWNMGTTEVNLQRIKIEGFSQQSKKQIESE
jgi:hypothetical protein